MCDPSIFRERVVNPNPNPTPPSVPPQTPPTPSPILELPPERGFDWVAQQPQAPEVTFQAAAPVTAADLSAEAVAKAAPQSLGGLAARFTIPTGKNGYSKSLRPEAGRLVR